MASVTTRRKGSAKYYRLIHKTGTRQYERYLGKNLPDDLNCLKNDFEQEILEREKTPLLEKIRKNHLRRIARADKKAIRSENHEFKINHIYSTQRIEGSTMTHGQTRNLLECNLSPKDTATEHIVEAQQMEKILDELLATGPNITKKLILDWHEKLFERTDTDNAGSFRRIDVYPRGGRAGYASWPDVIPCLDDLMVWHARNRGQNPVMRSAMFHNRFEAIHPFADGNGRIGRLLVLLILHSSGYPMMNILPKERLTYIKKLGSSQVEGSDTIFLKWFVSKYLRDHKRYLV